MSDAPARAWRFYVEDMIGFADRVMAYTHGMEQHEFAESALTRDATLRNLELIGEAATRIPPDVRERHADIPWRKIISTRNCLIHAYLGIDDDVVWSIIRDDIPSLAERLRQLADLRS